MSESDLHPPSPPVQTVFLDRDGVLNQKMPEGQYVTRWSEFHPLPGIIEAIRRLNQAAMRVIVVSNQRGIALGLYTSPDVEAIHTNFQELSRAQDARVDGFYFCPHDKGQCNCRKPLPGLFHQAKQDFPEIEAEKSLMIGDSFSDIEFGRSLGMTTIFIDGDPARQKPGAENARKAANVSVGTLVEAVDWVLQGANQHYQS